MDSKFAGFSKLNWLGLLTAVLPAFVGPVQEVIAAHPSASAGVVGVLTIILRTFFTSQAVTISPVK